ncbi:hypothetical protein X739_00785 [Mesorhizobium sp. LNHC220B00]|nr:hypothetical protein [Mesorhizobium sp. LNHC220B00]ESY89061.1 hypothetical protein X739_00785 [Mesorhizobium sp. LNHC220B00]
MTLITMLGLGAVTAAVLALAVTLGHWRPAPVRTGFEVRYEHRPRRST